ncbi:carboxyl-terminal processing protease [Desulfohalotomaculum tongense]|uniref:S41 family peptidase n=1 Tax=Desulforadius tongensis TaxID=1216062 RepID=UPI0019581239|nr:S41 family peptidase [Desulforadius tongensis]MBM7855048.1 carboxyl-terminal processing protease [Desulforadius tongensis]
MFKRLTFILIAFMMLVCVQPAAAFDDYVDGATTIEEILDYTLNNHVDKPELDVLVNGAIEGMLEALDDPYTQYMTPDSLQEFSDSLNGDYVGIGIRMEQYEGYVRVVEVFKNSPAEKAGLKHGDVIVAVDGEDIKDIPLGFVGFKIKGPEGTAVKLKICRNGEYFDATLTRAEVNAPTVTSKVMFNNIGYINIDSFGENTAGDFAAALQELKAKKVKGLILDLRDNPGGYLMAAVRMADHFLPVGKKVVSVVDRYNEKQVYRSFTPVEVKGLPVVILVNEGSASAAEILTGALQDHGVATVVGSQTYGKGTVQTVFNLSNGGALKLTMARYQLPGGEFIDGTGIMPDKQVLSPGLALHVARQIIQPTDQQEIIFTIDKNEAQLNGEKIYIVGKPYNKDGVYYVPLRFTMEALGCTVNLDEQRNGIQATKGDTGFFIPLDSGKTIHPVELSEGISYISVTDLKKLGINCTVKDNTVTVIED